MGVRTTLKRIERAEKALKKAANANPNTLKPLFRSEKTERVRTIGRLAFEAEVEAAAATMDGNAARRQKDGESETWESERC
jgi:hypothetical protein